MAFDTVEARLVDGADTASLLVELARTENQRMYGLQNRPRLDPESGMVFVFDEAQADTTGFWMWRTRIPLDIGFLDRDGRVLTVLQMEPCESPNPEWCPLYSPGIEYWGALEVNQGWFARHDMGPGALLEVDTVSSRPQTVDGSESPGDGHPVEDGESPVEEAHGQTNQGE